MMITISPVFVRELMHFYSIVFRGNCSLRSRQIPGRSLTLMGCIHFSTQ